MRAVRRVARRPVLTALGLLPWGRAADVLAVTTTLGGWLAPRRRRAALRWAGQHDATRWGRLRLATALLANRGRCAAFAARLGMPDPATYRRRIALQGTEHLDAARGGRGGTLLVGFHVGPGLTSAALRAHGYSVTSAGASGDEAWAVSFAAWDHGAPRVHWSGRAQERALGLLRLRHILLSGGIVAITADARSGRPSMWAAVPGGRLPLRSGWFLLRRQTGATALPVLGHLAGATQVITIHPPLPPPGPDAAADRESCQAAMSAILDNYARRHPAQAFSLAFQSEPHANGTP